MEPINVLFPLEGEWSVVTSPANHVPSHYTDAMGMSYAFDFAKPKDRQISFLSRLIGLEIESCEGWRAPVKSPFSGRVVACCNAVADRQELNALNDIVSGIKALVFYRSRQKVAEIFGNYVVIKGEECCCLLAHLRGASINLEVGDFVEAGQLIGEIGHSGSSQMPHLHFQLMDVENLACAKGIPVSFKLEHFTCGQWELMVGSVPHRNLVIKAANKSVQPTADVAAD